MNRNEYEVSLFILMVSCCYCGDSCLAACSAGLKFCFCFMHTIAPFLSPDAYECKQKDVYFNSTNVLLVKSNGLSIDETMWR